MKCVGVKSPWRSFNSARFSVKFDRHADFSSKSESEAIADSSTTLSDRLYPKPSYFLLNQAFPHEWSDRVIQPDAAEEFLFQCVPNAFEFAANNPD